MTETMQETGEPIVTTAQVALEQDRYAEVITIDDGKVNALTKAIIADIGAAVTSAEADQACAAVIITGREGRFSGGFDLEVMRSGDLSAVMDLVSDGGDLVRHLYGASVPVIAACSGHAVAAGALILLGCDVRVGVTGPFKIGLNEVSIGMTLPEWANIIARDRLSKRHLQRAITNARLTDAPTAADVGFLDLAVGPDELLDTAIAEAGALSTLDRAAYARAMREFRGATLVAMADGIAADRKL